MGNLYYLMGKSSSGKDSFYELLMQEESLHLKPIVLYTTRPIRAGETDGVQYHFTDEAGLEALTRAGKVIEVRAYDTVHGIWKYFTADDENIDFAIDSYLAIGTLQSYAAVRAYYGEQKVIPLYIETEDGIRLERALKREKKQAQPKYEEMCRRFLADQQDFSEENIEKAGIDRRFSNDGEKEDCLQEIIAFIRETEG